MIGTHAYEVCNGKYGAKTGFRGEYHKYGPYLSLELRRAAIHAYLRGDHPRVHSHEWVGAIAVLASLTCGWKDHELLKDVQEAYGKHRSTKQ
jgi:hypothetical protein